jgi:hypothetical protein
MDIGRVQKSVVTGEYQELTLVFCTVNVCHPVVAGE